MSSSKARFLSILAKDITTVGKVPSTNIVLPASGVTAATYGSATQIPVLTIDTEGRVTSASTTSVAGVSSFGYNTGSGRLTINTADGGSFTADVTLAPFTTTTLAEGTNQYFTTARARSSISATGTNLGYNSTTGVLSYTQGNTDTVAEGATNLYYTSARARGALSYTTGSAGYNSTSGQITIPGSSTDITEGTKLFFTDARARAALSGGTGVTYNSTTGVIAIGQPVATTDNVTFGNVTVNGTLTSDDITSTNITVSGNATITGNLTVSGTTTTVNSTTVSVADINIEVARNATTAAQANGAGLTVTGPTTPATLTYSSADDRWNLNKDLNINRVYGNLTGAVTGNASTASALQTARSITITGDGSWTVNFDGSANVSGGLTLANSGVTAGTYGSGTAIPVLTIDAKGRVTTATTTSVTIGDGAMTVTAGSGLTGGGQVGTANQTGASSVTISHADTSSVADQAAATNTFVSGITFDTYGHVQTVTRSSPSGFLTAESDTLATVTARGNSTSTNIGSTSGTPLALATAGNVGTWIGGIQDGTSGWSLSQATIGFKSDNNTYAAIGIATAQGLLYFGRTTASGVGTMSSWLEVNSAGVANFVRARPQYNGSNLALVSEIPSLSGYLTSESDTLATVTGRGASTSTEITLNGNSLWFGGSTYLRSNTQFSFLTNSGGAQAGKFLGIQVSDSYSGAVPTNGILFGTDTTFTRVGANSLQSSGDLRATIFYDSDDTSYYTDPNSGSRLAHIFAGNVSSSNDGGWNARMNLVGSSHARLDVVSNSDGIITTMYSHTGQGVGKIGTYSNHPLALMAQGAVVGGYVYNGSMRAPIFYDSDDTGYFANPNDISSFYGLAIRGDSASTAGSNQLFLWGSAGTTTSAIGFKQVGGVWGEHGRTNQGYNTYFTMDSAGRGWVFRLATVGGTNFTGTNVFSISNNAGETTIGSAWSGTANAQLNISQGQGGATLYRDIDLKGSWSGGEGHAISATHGSGITDLVGQMVFQHDGPGSRIKWGRLYASGNQSTWPMELINDGSGGAAYLQINSGSMRAPIFYDYNDTGYYVDANSRSIFSQIGAGGVSPDVQLSVNGTAHIGGTSTLYMGGTAGSYNSWGSRDYTSGSSRYFNANYFEFNNYGYGSTWSLTLSSGNLQSSSSHRAPIFYDSNDTTFYVDPASGSYVNGLVSADYIRVRGNKGIMGDYDTDGTASKVIWTIGASWPIGNMYGIGYEYGSGYDHHLALRNNGSTYSRLGFAGGMYLTGTGTASNDFRAPLFYDSNDTSYYVDPHSTSYQRSLFLGAHDSGDSEFRFGEDSSGWYGDRWYWDSAYTVYRYSRYAGSDSLIHYHDTRDGSRITYGRNIVFDNYGKGIVGVYSSYRYQGVFSMGDSYKLPADGTSTGSLYGLAWSHPNAGGVAANLNTHGLLAMENGTWLASLSGSVRARDDMRAPIFYDNNDTGYYVDPAASTSLRTVGDWRANASTWTGEYSGKIQYHSNNWYFQAADQFIWRNSGGSNVVYGDQSGNHWATSSSRSPIFYDNNDTGYYIDPNSSSTSIQVAGAIEQGHNYAHPNVEWSQSGDTTGEVIFYLPGTTGNYGMVHMVFDIYEYSSPRMCTVIVGGHNWSTNWYNVACNVVGYTNKSVRLGVKDGRFCVVFGGTGSVWSYGQIRLRKIQNGSYYNNIMDLGGNWSASITTTESFTNITGDLRGFRTPSTMEVDGNLYAYADVRSPIYYDYNDTGYYCNPNDTSRLVNLRATGHIYLNSGDPTIHFVDSNERGAALHNNSNLFYILSSNGTGGESWTTNNGYWPVYWNLNNNDATFGGAIWAAGNVTAYSDAKLKENIEAIDSPLDKVLKLRGVYYTLKRDESKTRKVGVIAQEIQEILPEVVLLHKDKEDEEGTLSVDYGNITAVLIEAIKEQDNKIKRLEALVETLINKLGE